MKFFADEQDFTRHYFQDYIQHWSGMSCPVKSFIDHADAVRTVARRYEASLGVAESLRRKALFAAKQEAEKDWRELMQWLSQHKEDMATYISDYKPQRCVHASQLTSAVPLAIRQMALRCEQDREVWDALEDRIQIFVQYRGDSVILAIEEQQTDGSFQRVVDFE